MPEYQSFNAVDFTPAQKFATKRNEPLTLAEANQQYIVFRCDQFSHGTSELHISPFL